MSTAPGRPKQVNAPMGGQRAKGTERTCGPHMSTPGRPKANPVARSAQGVP